MRRLGYVATAHRADDPTLTFNLITEVICLQHNRNERGALSGVLGLDRRGRDNNVKIPRVIEKKNIRLYRHCQLLLIKADDNFWKLFIIRNQ